MSERGRWCVTVPLVAEIKRFFNKLILRKMGGRMWKVGSLRRCREKGKQQKALKLNSIRGKNPENLIILSFFLFIFVNSCDWFSPEKKNREKTRSDEKSKLRKTIKSREKTKICERIFNKTIEIEENWRKRRKENWHKFRSC